MELEAGCFFISVEVGDLSHFGVKQSRRAQESMASHNLPHRRVSSEAGSVKVILRKEQREQPVLELQALKEPQDKVIEVHFLEQQGVFQAASIRGFIAARGGGGS